MPSVGVFAEWRGTIGSYAKAAAALGLPAVVQVDARAREVWSGAENLMHGVATVPSVGASHPLCVCVSLTPDESGQEQLRFTKAVTASGTSLFICDHPVRVPPTLDSLSKEWEVFRFEVYTPRFGDVWAVRRGVCVGVRGAAIKKDVFHAKLEASLVSVPEHFSRVM